MNTLRRWYVTLLAFDEPAHSKRRQCTDLVVLTLLGAAIVGLTLWSAHWAVLTDHPRSFAVTMVAHLAVYGLAAGWLIWRRPSVRASLLIIVLVAAAARIAFAPQVPTASSDIFRYVWDGRIQAQGINPYRYPPADAALEQYRDEAIYPGINRKPVPTIYPPVAQGVFRVIYLLHPDSVTWTKLALVGFDLATILVLAGLLGRLGLRPDRVLLYAWHPLLILELGHSGHIDVVAITFLALAVWARLAQRPILTGVLLACATLTKFYAIVALPALLWPGGWRAWRRDLQVVSAFVVSAFLAYLPFLGVGTRVFGYLLGYVQEEGIASGERFYLLRQARRLFGMDDGSAPLRLGSLALTDLHLYQVLVLGVLAALALWCWLRPLRSERDVPDRVLLPFLALFALTSPTYPWYVLLALVFLPFVGWRLLVPTSVLIGSAGLLYLQWWWPGQPPLPVDFAYGGTLVALAGVAAVVAVRQLGPRLSRVARLVPSPHLGIVAFGARPLSSPRAATPDDGADSLFERFPWLYSFCREKLFRDHTTRIEGAFWADPSLQKGGSLLEVGCGPGFYSRRFATRYRDLRVVGVDRAAAQVRRARVAARGLANCQFVQGDARALSQPSGSVDLLVASRLFTILPERERALAEMYRVLVPGGCCFIAEPRSRFWTALPLAALWLLAGLARPFGHAAGHYREPGRATVLSMEEFGALIASQPWSEAQHLQDRFYRYAVCRKAVPHSVYEPLAIAAD